MIPILYRADETSFTTNGIGRLMESSDVLCSEARNDSFELTLNYPRSGHWISEIKEERIIWAVPGMGRSPQPFQIYQIDRGYKTVQIAAEHISYRLSWIPMNVFKDTGSANAMKRLKNNTMVNNPFTFSTDVTSSAALNVETPKSVRETMMGSEGSCIAQYGGTWLFDKFSCRLCKARGRDLSQSVIFRLGRNVSDLSYSGSIRSAVTSLVPYAIWQDANSYSHIAYGDPKIITISTDINTPRIQAVDISSDIAGVESGKSPTAAQVTAAGKAYISRNSLGQPEVDLKITPTIHPMALTQSEYSLCDQITIYLDDLKAYTKVFVNKTTWDVRAERYTEIEVANTSRSRRTLARYLTGKEKRR